MGVSASIAYWFMLPAIQSMILPDAPGGIGGPWVIRSVFGLRFGAMLVMVFATIWLVSIPLRRAWRRQDAELGTRYDPLHDRPLKRIVVIVKVILLFAIYTGALALYLFSWEFIGPNGIEQRLVVTTLRHSYEDIESLETIPDGEHSDSIGQSGPYYCIKLKSGRCITLSDDQEGITREELRAVTDYVANRSGLEWVKRRDSRPRQRRQ